MSKITETIIVTLRKNYPSHNLLQGDKIQIDSTVLELIQPILDTENNFIEIGASIWWIDREFEVNETESWIVEQFRK
jgi:hypothetical protein